MTDSARSSHNGQGAYFDGPEVGGRFIDARAAAHDDDGSRAVFHDAAGGIETV